MAPGLRELLFVAGAHRGRERQRAQRITQQRDRLDTWGQRGEPRRRLAPHRRACKHGRVQQTEGDGPDALYWCRQLPLLALIVVRSISRNMAQHHAPDRTVSRTGPGRPIGAGTGSWAAHHRRAGRNASDFQSPAHRHQYSRACFGLQPDTLDTAHAIEARVKRENAINRVPVHHGDMHGVPRGQSREFEQ